MLRRLVLGLILIPSLAMGQAGPPYRNPVRDPKQIAEIAQSFAGSLRAYLGVEAQVRNCRHVVDQAVGTARGNHSYGAICHVQIGQKTSLALLCNDRMVGHLGVKAGTFVNSEDEVAAFTKQNCTGS